MFSSKSTFEMGFCSVHRRKRARADLTPLDEHPGQMRCKLHKECRQRTEMETVMCSLHNRRRSINQMKEVRKGVFECLPQFACRGQFSDGSVAQPSTSSSATQNAMAPYHLPSRGSRPQQGGRDFQAGTTASAVWAPTFGRTRVGNAASTSDWTQALRKTWCAKHGKLSSQCDLVKSCCYVCYDESVCLSTALEPPSELSTKGCKELLCSRHNALRLVDFLEFTSEKTGYQCVPGHSCRGALDSQPGLLQERGAQPVRDAVSSFFV
ncbi:hypothetical protein ERJ75_000792500 [Trypanosoma vivax]|uniref:Uncharacterized protein n=1 Tax=Trypanosoma vivax (strain Y486) TaxID=1055687 RepID=G0U8Q8_TRYVY|nr:hypothetical protein ERJ75_001817600 [Trypanosoma vivax]KAH8613378.1 hypothetical protein ERJ75_000792500 [Trypanosoma vivax]CCC53986.1 conserved hypothetical protein [Trypanosoma vivax Y486]